jgi:hypothetical protein
MRPSALAAADAVLCPTLSLLIAPDVEADVLAVARVGAFAGGGPDDLGIGRIFVWGARDARPKKLRRAIE